MTLATSFDTYADYCLAKAAAGEFQVIPERLFISLKLDLDNRETKLTDAEFDLIERNEDGRINDDFDMIWVWATDEQKARMHGDDWSRGDELDEELRCMMAEFC